MSEIQYLAGLWTLLLLQTGCVCTEIAFLERDEGGSVVLPCAVDKKHPSPYGVYLKRRWLQQSEVLFMYTQSDPSMSADHKNRTSVNGDPDSHTVNVTISQLRASDTDRYYCEFVVDNPSSKDLRLQGNTEFFLLVNSDSPRSMDIGLVNTCAGGSAVIPCLPPRGETLAIEAVSLKRQKSQGAPVELLYHSKHQPGNNPSTSFSSSSWLPEKRVQLSSTLHPEGITYNLTLLQLQPEDSALYSCVLLQRGSPDKSTHFGRKVFYVSVQGGSLLSDQCGCSGYSTLLYALSAAVAILLLLLFIKCVLSCKGKTNRRDKSHPQIPIYEEMTGVKSESRKLAPHHLEEMDSSEYKNCDLKRSCPENYYEHPTGSLHPRKVSP
ncbi:cd7 antigen-like [Xyrichtys novacula]|uniref:Cd7 antigen-like n=1 Tax=Xyrichtys novacula TaxID=13765 RepID=A0AAV1EXU9_XYRNO|nr:cd7 antigen-like [Xyrichtys novacula]